MSYVRSRHVWFVLPGFAAGGAGIGLALPAMKTFAASHFGRAGLAVFFVINIAMPLLVVAMSAAYPRPAAALVGALLATMAFLLAAGFVPPPASTRFAANLLAALGPIMTVACVMYHVLALGTALAVRPWRRVGAPPDPNACPYCGYDLRGLTAPRCPECSRRFNPENVGTR